MDQTPNTEEAVEFQGKAGSAIIGPCGRTPPSSALADVLAMEGLRRTMAVANSDASSLLGVWSVRRDNRNRTLSHFVDLWDG